MDVWTAARSVCRPCPTSRSSAAAAGGRVNQSPAGWRGRDNGLPPAVWPDERIAVMSASSSCHVTDIIRNIGRYMPIVIPQISLNCYKLRTDEIYIYISTQMSSLYLYLHSNVFFRKGKNSNELCLNAVGFNVYIFVGIVFRCGLKNLIL